MKTHLMCIDTALEIGDVITKRKNGHRLEIVNIKNKIFYYKDIDEDGDEVEE